jgi:hypothetical protein
MKSLRLVLLLIILAGAVGYVAAEYWPTARRRALARVEALHGTFAEQLDEEDGPHRVNIVMLLTRPVAEEDLAALRDLRPLHRVLLDGSPVTDTGLAHLGELPELEFLSLGGTGVTDDGLASLRGLKRLKVLILCRTRVTDAGLVHLRELTGLKALSVADTRVTERGIAELRRTLPGLTHVFLDKADDPG